MKKALGHIRIIFAIATAFIFLLPIVSMIHAGEPGDRTVTLLKDGDYFPALIEAINSAGNEIVMSFFMFKTGGGQRTGYTDILLGELGSAVKRGVHVKVVLERGKDGESFQVDRGNVETAARLRKSGVDVYYDSPVKTTHTKVAVIDRRYLFVGSHNLTNSALKYNHELSVLIDSPSLAQETMRYIDSLYE